MKFSGQKLLIKPMICLQVKTTRSRSWWSWSSSSYCWALLSRILMSFCTHSSLSGWATHSFMLLLLVNLQGKHTESESQRLADGRGGRRLPGDSHSGADVAAPPGLLDGVAHQVLGDQAFFDRNTQAAVRRDLGCGERDAKPVRRLQTWILLLKTWILIDFLPAASCKQTRPSRSRAASREAMSSEWVRVGSGGSSWVQVELLLLWGDGWAAGAFIQVSTESESLNGSH